MILRAAALCMVCACTTAPRALAQSEAAPPLEHAPPSRVTELDTERGFGTLETGEGDAGVRALALRLVGVLADEDASQLRLLLGRASWQPGIAKGTPVDELTRRFALLDYQTLRGPLAQGAFDAMRVRRVDDRSWDVRLPLIAAPEPLFAGRPVLRIAREGDTLAITGYGED